MTMDTQTRTYPASHQALSDLLEARFSCRAFEPREVDRPTIERLVTLAQRSPSWCNTQPWRVHITTGAATERLRGAAMEAATTAPPSPDIPFPDRYEGAARERRLECALQLYESVGIERGDRAASAAQALKNFDFFGAPHLAVVTTERALGAYGAVDCGVYLGCFLLAAQSLGLAAIPQAAIAAVAPAMREQLEVEDDRQVLFGVSFGHPDMADPVNQFRTTRADAEQVVTWV